jgi:hypothetical protein
VSSRSVLELNQPKEVQAILDRVRRVALVHEAPETLRRCKIWDIAPAFHCSIIGTCLTAAELRHFFVKLRQPDAKSATDHDLHGRGVCIAGKRDDAAKLLQKWIDKRHETAIKRFAKASTATQVRDLWLQALASGDIPGAYWAVHTHPAADRSLINQVFGEVHMLSHLVGSSNRLDIARLRKLEIELGESVAKLARQEVRIQSISRERSELLRRVEELQAFSGQQTAREQATADALVNATLTSSLQYRLDAEKAHSSSLTCRLKAVEEQVRISEERACALLDQNHQLQQENAALEAALRGEAGSCRDIGDDPLDLHDLTLLYVGGRPKLIYELKAITVRRGGTLLTHDGGIEDSSVLLPGLISQADGVFFPVDCISHLAMGKMKKACFDAGKSFVPLRTASVASFLAAVGTPGVFLPARTCL